MFASRKIRMLALVAIVAALFIAVAGTSAEAGCHCGHVYKPVHFVKYAPLIPITKYITQPYTYPVVVYDCYGLPQTVWKTGYKTVAVTVYR
jgi:hypothetical protein